MSDVNWDEVYMHPDEVEAIVEQQGREDAYEEFLSDIEEKNSDE